MYVFYGQDYMNMNVYIIFNNFSCFPEVEIPAVSMSGLNGDSIDHLAKADLLEESNSSDSHEKSSNVRIIKMFLIFNLGSYCLLN